MRWFKIIKDTSQFPIFKRYNDSHCKEALLQEAKNQCVYCTIGEAHFGGYRNFHVEHYRPQSRFPELENDYSNLFICCSICGCYKGSDWPAEPEAKYETTHYPCPAEVDYCELLNIDETRQVQSNFVTGLYLIERLHLNRPQLIYWRKGQILMPELSNLVTEALAALARGDAQNKGDLLKLIGECYEMLVKLTSVVPYEMGDLRNS
jgi:uncharacterized protein (TIGR02646 family)